MKKIETLLNKLSKITKEIAKENNFGEMELLFLVFMTIYTGIAIWLAVAASSYAYLSVMTFVWSWIISECIIRRKVFLKKIDNYLLQTPKTTKLILSIFLIASIILALKYWIGCIFTAILAFMIADYRKMRKENNKMK